MWETMDEQTRQVFDDFLFSKGCFVNRRGEDRQDCVRVLYALASVFGIKIVRGLPLAEWHMAETAGRGIGEEVPQPFYTGFPQSVLKLTEEQLLVDQLIHYAVTYGLDNFSLPGHSLLEEEVERLAFREKTEVREFEILEETEALARLKTYVKGLLSSARPLNAAMENLAVCFARLFPDDITVCACKDTAIRLLYETGNVRYARFLRLPDVIRLADEINWAGHLPSPTDGKLEKIRARKEAALDALFEQKKAEYDRTVAAYNEYRAARGRYEDAMRQYEADLAAYAEKKRLYDLTAETPGAAPAEEPRPPVLPAEPERVNRPGWFIPPDLSDVMRADTRRSVRTLNLRNRDRRLISAVIDYFFDGNQPDIRDCYEKKQLWAGLLHHIHYKPKNEAAVAFVRAMRGKGKNRSVPAGVEAAVAQGDVKKAADLLAREKGGSAVGRSLNYLLSRCRDASDVEAVISRLDGLNMTVMIQLLAQYRHYRAGARTFKFVRHHLLTVHHETDGEAEARRSVIPPSVREMLSAHLNALLQKALAERDIGRVYVEDGMERIAVPIQEASGSSGFGVLPRGSRIRIGEGRKLRCFTYWEKADDIDLACFGLGEDGAWQKEFSWRTMSGLQDRCVTFSGDETSGRLGGSEYYDVVIPEFRERYPDVRYLVFTDNVFRGAGFKDIFCTAGYMIREEEDSGEIFEPKTVRSSFRITAESAFAVLFALDLKEWDLIWLNLGMDSDSQVAGDNGIAMVRDYLDIAEAFNLGMLFRGMASGVTDRPEDADVILADHYGGELRPGQKLIRSCDFELIHEYMNAPSGKKA